MRIIAISNQKGGVGKTTSCASIAAGFKRRGYKVLAVDLDASGNLSVSVGAERIQSYTIYDLLKRECKPEDAIQHLDAFDIIPSNSDMANAESEIIGTSREYRLREVLEPIQGKYDFVIVDTPPSLGILTVLAFAYATEVIIPSEADSFSVSGLQQLSESVAGVKKYINPNLKITGILLTMYEGRMNISQAMRETTNMLCDAIGAPVFKTYIRRSTSTVRSAQAEQEEVFSYNPKSTTALDYDSFVNEYLSIGGQNHG